MIVLAIIPTANLTFNPPSAVTTTVVVAAIIPAISQISLVSMVFYLFMFAF